MGVHVISWPSALFIPLKNQSPFITQSLYVGGLWKTWLLWDKLIFKGRSIPGTQTGTTLLTTYHMMSQYPQTLKLKLRWCSWFGWVWYEHRPLSKLASHVCSMLTCALAAGGGCVLVCVPSASQGVAAKVTVLFLTHPRTHPPAHPPIRPPTRLSIHPPWLLSNWVVERGLSGPVGSLDVARHFCTKQARHFAFKSLVCFGSRFGVEVVCPWRSAGLVSVIVTCWSQIIPNIPIMSLLTQSP